jgi:hypothetical protein
MTDPTPVVIFCETHGSVQAYVDRNHNAWCPQCRTDMIREALKDPEKRAELAAAMVPHSMGMSRGPIKEIPDPPEPPSDGTPDENQLPEDFHDEWGPLAGKTSTFFGIPLEVMTRADLLATIAFLGDEGDKAREREMQASRRGMQDLFAQAKAHLKPRPNPMHSLFPIQPLPEAAAPIYDNPDFDAAAAVTGCDDTEDSDE